MSDGNMCNGCAPSYTRGLATACGIAFGRLRAALCVLAVMLTLLSFSVAITIVFTVWFCRLSLFCRGV